jgi:hypothetical protein
MTRGATFKQSDITKAIKAAVRAGVKDWRVEIADGKIIVVPGDHEQDDLTKSATLPPTALDQWRRERGQG